MSEKFDSTAWTGDYPSRQNAPFTVANGQKVAKIVILAVGAALIVSGLLIAGGLI